MPDSQNATSRRALVTGAAGGIGSEVCRQLNAKGYLVTIVDIDGDAAEALARDLGIADVWVVDLSDRSDVTGLMRQIELAEPSIELAFLNAGCIHPGHFADQTSSDIDQQIDVNLRSTTHLLHSCARAMKRRGGGHIVVTLSMGGIFGLAESPIYSATKFGLRGLLMSIQSDLQSHGVNVSGIFPGAVDTPMLLHEALCNGTALNFLSAPQSAKAVANAFFRALKRPRLEIYVSLSDCALSFFLKIYPSIVPKLYPLLSYIGEKGRRKFLQEKLGKIHQ